MNSLEQAEEVTVSHSSPPTPLLHPLPSDCELSAVSGWRQTDAAGNYKSRDLKAFERRLTEYVSCLQPATGRWRMILIVVSVCTATGAWNWLIDPETQKVSFFTSLWNHPFFTISCITLIGLFFAGIHKRVVAPSIIAARCRTVLAEYNMSCDDTGKLILKPRPHVQ
ncbi:nuclear envelope phosphatase-regulatory subunit 1 isoform X2 [Rhinoderma darwinii]|uniref:nuclear envelope phosphatase-regulatory subunit 1 isoform X2 n=1 Tax=Rhinoderma darwinii TaxID=43563 RepID=UPI003F67BC71